MPGSEDLNFSKVGTNSVPLKIIIRRSTTMRIMDYETRRTLNDVGVTLTMEEADELCTYLQRLRSNPGVQHVHLSEIVGNRLEREITVTLAGHSG